MIVGILYLIATIGIGIVVVWSLKNDDVPLGGKTTGVLAMRETEPSPKDAARGSRRRADGGQPTDGGHGRP